MNYENIIYSIEDGIAIIKLNRPERFNALNKKLMEELENAIDRISVDDGIKSVMITGDEKSFAAGADINEIREIKEASTAFNFAKGVGRVYNKIENLEKPVIAVISGYALGGGCELILACDLRIASPDAKFGLPEIKLGLLPGGGGTQRLLRLVGATKAKELLYLGDPIGAEEALKIGLINRIYPKESIFKEGKKLAKKLSKQAPVALRMIKSLINIGMNLDLKGALENELKAFSILFSTEDKVEGINAFLEKREANFKGR
jgi:enoyl-CoA hydratase